MNWLDLTIIAIIAIFTLIGFSRGLISQIFSIAALAGGLAIGFIFYDVLGDVFIKEKLVGNEPIANIGGFIILAFTAYVIIQMLGWAVSRLIGTLQLSWLNRICGGVAGAAMGTVTAFLLLSCLSLFHAQNDPIFKNSELVPYLDRASLIVKDYLPKDFEKSFEKARELVREEGLKAAMRIKDSNAVKEILNDYKESQRKNN
ncbi:MAG: CvpA family protein [Thermodesulfobacteriota bacterium]